MLSIHIIFNYTLAVLILPLTFYYSYIFSAYPSNWTPSNIAITVYLIVISITQTVQAILIGLKSNIMTCTMKVFGGGKIMRKAVAIPLKCRLLIVVCCHFLVIGLLILLTIEKLQDKVSDANQTKIILNKSSASETIMYFITITLIIMMSHYPFLMFEIFMMITIMHFCCKR